MEQLKRHCYDERTLSRPSAMRLSALAINSPHTLEHLNDGVTPVNSKLITLLKTVLRKPVTTPVFRPVSLTQVIPIPFVKQPDTYRLIRPICSR